MSWDRARSEQSVRDRHRKRRKKVLARAEQILESEDRRKIPSGTGTRNMKVTLPTFSWDKQV